MAISTLTRPVENHLQQYIPLPFQEIMQASQAIAQRGELAQQQQSQMQAGLSSMEANAPAYAQFRDKFASEYKDNASKLLDKFGGNASNPEFISQMRALNLQYASDPRLTTVRQGNEFIKSNEKLRQELDAKGEKYLDPLRGFTGTDANGNLIAPSKGVHAATFDKDIDFLLDPASKAFNYNGYYKTNKKALMGIAKEITSNPQYEPIIRQTTQYFQQQGMDLASAYKSAAQYVATRAQSRITNDFDSGLASYDESVRTRRLQEQMAKQAIQPIPNALPYAIEQLPVSSTDIYKDKLSKIDDILGGVNAVGGLKKSTSQSLVENTVENRNRYAGKYEVVDKYSTPGGPGAVPVKLGSQLRLPATGGYNTEAINTLKEARQLLGDKAKYNGRWLSDAKVLQKYKDALANDNSSLAYFKPNNKEYVNALTSVRIGEKGQNIGQEFTAYTADGPKTNDRKGVNPLEGLSAFTFGGVNPVPQGKYTNGTMKINAVDKKGNPVPIVRPLDKHEQSMFELPNKIYQISHSPQGQGSFDYKGRKVYVTSGLAEDGTIQPSAYYEEGGKKYSIPFNKLVSDTFNDFYKYQQPTENIK